MAFGRAGRMSGTDVTSYGVYAAARELRYDDDLGRDIATRYIDLGDDLRDHQAEWAVLERWLQGISPGSAYFRQPDRAS